MLRLLYLHVTSNNNISRQPGKDDKVLSYFLIFFLNKTGHHYHNYQLIANSNN